MMIEFDALEVIAVLFAWFLFMWGFRVLFVVVVGYGVGGMMNANKGTKVSKGEEKKESDSNGYASEKDITSDSFPA